MCRASLWQAVAQTPHPMQTSSSNRGAIAFFRSASRRDGTICTAATGQARAQREHPLQRSTSARGAKPLPFTALSPQRFAAWSCSQQQPQQLQTKVGRSWTLSAIWTSPFSREAARMSRASDRSTARPNPRRVTKSAPPFSVRQTSTGASQACPRCSCLWRQ